MKKWIGFAAAGLLAGCAAIAAPTSWQSFSVLLSQSPVASSFGLTDQLYLRQGGVSKQAVIGTVARVKFTAQTNFFADFLNGNDSNNCLSAGVGNACKTVQGAYNKLSSQYDTAGFNAIINVANNDNVCLGLNSAWIGGGQLFIIGPGGSPPTIGLIGCPGNGVIVNTTLPANLVLRGLVVSSTSPANSVVNQGVGQIILDNVAFQAAGGVHIYAVGTGAKITCQQPTTLWFMNQTNFAFLSQNLGQFYCPNTRIAIVGAQTYATFAWASDGANIYLANTPFCTTGSGACSTPSVTATRFNATMNGTVDTASGTPNQIPGNVNGTLSLGGQAN